MMDFWASIWENLPDWGPQMLVAAVQTLKLTAASFVLAVLNPATTTAANMIERIIVCSLAFVDVV